jgi:hypothetical protein
MPRLGPWIAVGHSRFSVKGVSALTLIVERWESPPEVVWTGIVAMVQASLAPAPQTPETKGRVAEGTTFGVI